MREPVFNETMQLRIVVRDLEATVRRYEDDYGIGPWQFARIDLGEENDYREAGSMLRCEHSGVDIAYLDTQHDLGVVLEVFSGMPSNGWDPDST